ncbi:methyltransferase domain-containing protein [Streptomyces sp. NBC_01498]|uniref:methyltransferase domain-containing protein n=1 Tax=Streptomyces sp. NBC_01498 TaxID=2975870 RepID=UPI002E7BBD09|nr:methyltransferase domain-containing protein [Streptomyces sp. NBC_01498]WTL24566.1 methyltransferase domain-containing protein [Streptomyces sp. NBC_01498]
MRTNDAQMLVLCALTDGPLHGYAINTAIEKLSGRRLGPGSLYGALARLEAHRLVEPLEGTGRQRPVGLTAAGRELLDREAHSMARLSGRVFESAVPDEIGYLDRVAASEAGRSYKTVMLDALATRPGHTVLDLGCGPGTDLTTLATAAGPSGRVIGIDSNPEMVTRARTRTEELPAVDVWLGDIHALPLADGSVDRARTDRVLQHVDDPARALAEIRRVLRPGGRLVMGEPDWDSLCVDHPDIETARAYTRHVTDKVVRNGVLGRQLPRLAAEAGFSVPTVAPMTSVFRDVRSADQVLGLQRNTERAVAAGYLSPESAREWLDHLASGPFLATVTLYVVVAEATVGT